MSGLSKSHLASLAALGLAGMGPTTNGALNPTGKLFRRTEKVTKCWLNTSEEKQFIQIIIDRVI